MDATDHREAVGVRDFDRRDQSWPERTTASEDLRLRQVERVLPFDVPRRNVVGDRVGENLSLAANDDREFRLGRRERRIRA